MKDRSFGWIQNPSSISNLKNTIGLFSIDSHINYILRTDLLPRLIHEETVRDRFIEQLRQPEHGISYDDLKGKGNRNQPRSNAPCSGIVQAALVPQKPGKEYTDDRSADGFLRWGISIGFLEYIRESDSCKITPLGNRFINTEDNSDQEKQILGDAYLSYPPVI